MAKITIFSDPKSLMTCCNDGIAIKYYSCESNTKKILTQVKKFAWNPWIFKFT